MYSGHSAYAEFNDEPNEGFNEQLNSDLIIPYAKYVVKHPNDTLPVIGFGKAVSVGGRTTNHSSVSNRTSLPTTSQAQSSMDLISNNAVKQRRYFDENGKALRDIDYFHTGEASHTFPHIHMWTWTNNVPMRSNWIPASFY
ncbi:hypothetical protein [Metasolibacillus sp.]|uniref:hypothetical protein n=1 Tax=Metasolibacillus sp. TaxID=2703680 RepID=UPI0025F18751|nr:hypothetical protein [Metasolibacillus sp.]MCT6926101.1 hypothetical protein [Metasolibacillus sp.]MCT6942300.1 hypothetical protein [Metasolibacillus sp.]